MTSPTSNTDDRRSINGVVPSQDGTPIGFTRTGAGPCLVLVEPVGHFRDFSAFDGLEALLVDCFSVIVYDRRGRGASTPMASRYSPQREVEDLAAIISAEAGGSAFVYGYSSGALVALHAAAAEIAIDRLAALDPPAHDQDADRPDPLTARLWNSSRPVAMTTSIRSSMRASGCRRSSSTRCEILHDGRR